MPKINIRRRHDEDLQYRIECRAKVAKYERYKVLWRQHIEGLSHEKMLAMVGAKKVQRINDLKEYVIQLGLKPLDDLIEYWTEEAEQGSYDPLTAARL